MNEDFLSPLKYRQQEKKRQLWKQASVHSFFARFKFCNANYVMEFRECKLRMESPFFRVSKFSEERGG